jgi:hypothetical protein
MLKAILREPLVHFILLGAALFFLDAWLRPTGAAPESTEIVVSEARILNLEQNFRRTWQRPPTPDELDGLVKSHIREEVMVREALALGLDRDDTIIRRRLQQKMEFVSEEAAALTQPTDEELNAYLKAHADRFRNEPRVTFSQIYFDPRKHASRLKADVERVLVALNSGNVPPDSVRFGDSLSLLESRYEDESKAQVARLFGTDFADALVKQTTGQWVGPIASGYGVHLVKLESLVDGRVPELSEIRPLVEREWANTRRQEASRAFYEKLRAKYVIKVQMPKTAKP